ncbi:MAG: shikimate dehydrogenase [Eubacteriales bacterium]|jgi:shikimate dehydrogenase|nr:shikimate dehydrogenase [Eubacteriales bacterium]
MKEQNYLDSLVGVIGHPAAENPGVAIQDAAFRALGLNLWRYLTIDVDPDKLEDAIKGLRAFKMRGINCTIPHKINVIPYLDALSESARLIGAVNTIVNNDGKLFGENTDGKGFMESLQENGVDPNKKKIVILGAGGAARAVSVELSLAGAGSITIVNRPEDAHLAKSLMELLNKIIKNNSFVTWDHTYQVPADTDILVNATSIGLYPNIDDIPNIDLDTILPTMFVQDVIPNPAITPFLRAAEARGARWNTGTGMLINQAALNIEMWTGKKPDKAVMLKALQEALN